MSSRSLDRIVSLAVVWALQESRAALEFGVPLNATGLQMARDVGVACPENIRVIVVDAMPMPADETLRQLATAYGLLGPTTGGLALEYAVFIKRGHETLHALLRHEFRHVYQYEQAGSVEAFLRQYVSQILRFGYDNAPLELDAVAYEIHEALPRMFTQ